MEVLRSIWLFIKNQILGMKWLNKVIGNGLNALGVDITSRWGGSTAVLYFLRKGVKLLFFSLGTIFEENMRVSRGMQSLGSGFPIGARSIPVGTRFCLQSLVCYTFCDR